MRGNWWIRTCGLLAIRFSEARSRLNAVLRSFFSESPKVHSLFAFSRLLSNSLKPLWKKNSESGTMSQTRREVEEANGVLRS